MASGNDPPQLPRGLIGRTGNPSAKGARLPSIRGPRDLTLGGVQKKVFTPNIPARRAKPAEGGEGESSTSKPAEAKQKKSHGGRSHSDRGRDHRGGHRGGARGRGRTNANVIQTHSLFEQGPAADKGHKSGAGTESAGARYGGSSGSDSRSTVKKERVNSDTKQVLDHLLRDDFIAGQGGLDEEDVTLVPVRLPLEMKAEAGSKTELDYTKVKVKAEPMEVDGEKGADPSAEKGAEPSAEKTDFQPMKANESAISCADLFTSKAKSEDGELLFFQLPDMLPGLPLTTEDEFRGKKATEKTENDKESDLEKKMKSCGLGSFGEGLIGKLVVRKSGRVQLMLGTTALDVNMGANCGFLQDLVSVRVDGDHGSVSVLGHVAEHSLVCTPDFETMLDYT